MSFDLIDFSLRPNKAIERKLIFEALASLQSHFRWVGYQYVGFGALWFRDFAMAHRVLGIKRMHSIEMKAAIAARAEKSKPLGCITVHEGRASAVLLDPELELAERDTVAWLDYEDTVTPEIVADVERLGRDLRVGSVILVTVNASPGSLVAGSDSLEDKNRERGDKLRELFGEWVPDVPPQGYFSAALDKYPFRLSELLWARAIEVVAARTNVRMASLFNFAYKDNAPMLTVGGMIVDDRTERILEESGVRKRLGVLRSPASDATLGWPRLREQVRIEVPVLTRLERLKLNRQLPGRLTKTRMRQLCGAEFTEGERFSYGRFYNHIPAFGEFDL